MLKKIIFLTLLLFSLGNITSLSRFNGLNMYLFDVGLLLTNVYLLLIIFKKRIFEITWPLIFFKGFAGLALISTILFNLQIGETAWILSLGYLIRFINYGVFGFLIYMLIKSKTLLKSEFLQILYWNFVIVLFLNFIQYFFFRDISFFSMYGFDPHQERLTGTFLDPNFMGMYLILIFLFSELEEDFKYLGIISFIQILLTSSRSAVVCLILALIYLLFKKPKYWLYLIFLILFTYTSSLNQRFELASRSNDSIALRYESWRNAVMIYQNSPYFGIGFNNYKNFLIFENLISPEQYESNSVNSSDSSLLSVLVMTGLVGLFLYFGFLFSFLNNKNLVYLAVILVHSLVINSLFYPSIAVLLFVILNFNKV